MTNVITNTAKSEPYQISRTRHVLCYHCDQNPQKRWTALGSKTPKNLRNVQQLWTVVQCVEEVKSELVIMRSSKSLLYNLDNAAPTQHSVLLSSSAFHLAKIQFILSAAIIHQMIKNNSLANDNDRDQYRSICASLQNRLFYLGQCILTPGQSAQSQVGS